MVGVDAVGAKGVGGGKGADVVRAPAVDEGVYWRHGAWGSCGKVMVAVSFSRGWMVGGVLVL